MRRHLIAGALACFGSNLFGQTLTNPASQPPGALNNVQNTLQNGLQNAQNTVDRSVPQNSGTTAAGTTASGTTATGTTATGTTATGTTAFGNGQNRSSLNAQGQVNGTPGVNANAGIQSNTNLQNNYNGQPGQVNSNLSTQFQGQPASGTQQSGNTVGQNFNNTYPSNVSNGSQFPQRQAQQMQSGQSQTQGWNAETGQNSGTMQNQQRSDVANPTSSDNARQSSPTQNNSSVYMLRFDASGREFICVNGTPIYFDNVSSTSKQGNTGTQSQYRAGYGNYDSQSRPNTQDQSRNSDQRTTNQQASGSAQRSNDNTTNSRTVDPAISRQPTNGPDLTSPSSDSLDLNEQNQSRVRQNDSGTRSDLDVKSDTSKPSDSSEPRSEPKE